MLHPDLCPVEFFSTKTNTALLTSYIKTLEAKLQSLVTNGCQIHTLISISQYNNVDQVLFIVLLNVIHHITHVVLLFIRGLSFNVAFLLMLSFILFSVTTIKEAIPNEEKQEKKNWMAGEMLDQME